MKFEIKINRKMMNKLTESAQKGVFYDRK